MATPGSDAADNNPPPPPTDASPEATASQKRGRGRPPKSKSDSQPNGAVSARKPSGRPKRNATTAGAVVPAASATAAVRSGRGRPKRSSTVAATEESQVTGSRKRGRPKKDDVAPSPAQKRGRKPKTEQVAKQRTSNRTRKATKATTGQGAADPKELKKTVALLQKKVKQAADKLKIAVSAIDEVQKIADGM